jgi:CSLREA domain-containing protein
LRYGAIVALAAAAPLRAAQFTVVSTADTADTSPGDGLCLAPPPVIAGNAPADAGLACTLRAAIEEANALDGTDSIVFSPALDGTAITLGSQLPAVTSEITITGNGAASTIVQAATCDPVTLPGGCTPATWRVFEIGAAGNLTLADLAVRHGNCAGACATKTNKGGGILNSGTLALTSVSVAANSAGATANDYTSGGAGIENAGGTITAILDSAFSGNRAAYNGGAIENYIGSSIGQITGSHFLNNQARYGAGLIDFSGIGQISHTSFIGNTATGGLDAYGGGIYAVGAIALIEACTFDGNSSTVYGGGIYAESTDAIGVVIASLFTGNSSASGGGLMEYDGSMGAILNSTFSGNTATIHGGGIELGSGGATIVAIINTTITGNTAPLGANVYSASNTAIPIQNSIFGVPLGGGANFVGTSTDAGGNFSDDMTPSGAAAIVPGVDYDLALAANGGPTKTHALLAGSPAIDATGTCPAALHNTDQRGAPRDASCDSGAYEYNFIFADGFEGK